MSPLLGVYFIRHIGSGTYHPHLVRNSYSSNLRIVYHQALACINALSILIRWIFCHERIIYKKRVGYRRATCYDGELVVPACCDQLVRQSSAQKRERD